MSNITESAGSDKSESVDLHREPSQEDVQSFRGNEDEEQGQQLQKTPSMLQRMQSKLSFFNDELEGDRKTLVLRFGLIYVIMGVLIVGIFSVYWGSMYNRDSRIKNLRMLVVIEDDSVIGSAVRNLLETPEAKYYGDWLIQNNTAFNAQASRHNNTVAEEIEREVHHQHYWSSIYVKANASVNLYNAILAGDTAYNSSYNSVVSYYETGRDFLSMNSYVTPSVEFIEQLFLASQSEIMDSLLQNETLSKVFATSGALAVVSTPLEWTFIDGRPYTDPVLVAPSQVGLIYMVIVTFFAFNFFGDVHMSVAKLGVKKVHLVLYRVISTVVSFFVISFFYSLVTLVFQVDFTKTFGHSGFLVYWMTNFLTMWAVGCMNEVAAMVFIMFYPPLVGFWMLFWVITNISPTFTPLALSPKFYRYGYAMPLHASYEITKVIFFDTYKGALGRNYGILIAWVVIATLLLIVVFAIFGKTMGKRAAIARAKQEKEFEEKLRRDEEQRINFD